MLDRFAPLETTSLRLEPISPARAAAIARGDLSGLEVGEGWPQPGTTAGISLALEHGHPPGWLVCFSALVVGDCGIRAPADAAGCVEIGYGLAAPYRGRGLGSEVVAAISDWLLGQAGISAVCARTEPLNAASRRVLEKAGFVLVDTSGELTRYEKHRP